MAYDVKYILTVFFVLLLKQAVSQNTDYFERITTEKGLSQSDVNAIIQDDDGFMWFGTHDGLNRYDGYSFKVFKPNNNKAHTISSNLIFALEKDQKGNLWIGTTGGGLVYFDKITEKFTTFKHDENDNESINGNHIATLYRDRENRLWVGTGAGLNMVDLKNPVEGIEFIRFRANQKPFVTDRNIRSVNAVFEDANGQIWIGGYGGIYKLSRESNGDMYFRYMNDEIGLPIVAVRCIREYKGRLLIATSEGLYFQKTHTNTFSVEKVIDGAFDDVLINNDVLWAGTNTGLWELKFSANETIILVKKHTYDPKNLNSISKNNIVSLYRDKTGLIWAGTNGGGVNKLDPNRKRFVHVRKTSEPTSLSYDKIRAFFEDSRNRLWVGTEGGGLNLLRNNSSYNNFLKLNSILNVYAIAEINRGNKNYLLFGGQGDGGASLMELDITSKSINFQNLNSTNKITPINDFSNSIFSLLSDSRNQLWIGTYSGGLYRWKLNSDGRTYQKDHFVNDDNDSQSLSGNIIRNIFEDSFGNIWLATNNGLSMLPYNQANKKYPTFTVFRSISTNKNTISHNYILSVHEDREKNIWVGTFGGGLNMLQIQEEGTYLFSKTYSEKDGLPNDVIKGILEDNEGYLWLSTNKGLSRFDTQEGHFKNYDVNDGLQSNEFQELAYYRRKNGEFLFGGVNGYNAFYPSNLRDNTYKPETVITNFYVSNEEVSVDKEFDGEVLLDKAIYNAEEINLKHFQNNISFEFAALHFAAPEKNKFKYKLDGFDNDWETSPSNKRYAAYTNLSPGRYTFKVKASNNDGLWNEIPARIKIRIYPPFWQTWWAYLIYALLILGLLWSIQSYFNLRSKQRASLQVQREIEHVNKLKLQFFTNISHEFKTPITLILNPIEEILDNIQDNLSIKPKLQIIQRNANSLLRLVNQLMEFRRIEVGETKLAAKASNLVNFVKEVTHSFKASAAKNDIELIFKSDLKTSKVWFDWDKLEKILNNLIFNAIKFTNPGGTIQVRVSQPIKAAGFNIKDLDKATKYVTIEVEDNGVGIKNDELPYVFHRFYQVNQTRKRTRKGSGIGLAITKDLVELHHGVINVESKVGKGTKFTILLPLGKAHLLPEEMDETGTKNTRLNFNFELDEESADNNLVDGSKTENSILIVDDNADIRQLVREDFSNTYKVLEAENGKEGLKIALKEMPDLIVSDILMPEMDGIDFCAAVKNNIRTSHIPVILLTALNSVEHRIEGLESGADAYIPKPFKMKLLSVRIQKLIQSRDAMRKRFQTEKELTPEMVTLSSLDESFLKKVMECMETNMGNENYWVDELTKDMSTSRSTFFRKLKKLTGQSPNDFMRMVRLKRAVQLLEQDELTIAQISYMVGFNDPGYFGKCFRKAYGVSPSNYLVQEQQP